MHDENNEIKVKSKENEIVAQLVKKFSAIFGIR
jgi:hypothetical protein